MANEKQLKILIQGVDVWNKWRKRHSEAIDLRESNLSGKDLYGADLRHADLYNTNLYRVDLRKSNLTNASLYRTNLEEAHLCGAKLQGADLRKANLQGADLSGDSNGIPTDLRGAYFCYANLIKTNFKKANLCDANLSYSNLTWANLEEAVLRRANLKKATLTNASLCKADLYNADLNEAVLKGAHFLQTSLRKTNLSSANLEGSRFIEANLSFANISNCKVYGVSAWNVKMNSGTDQSNLIITPDEENTITVDNLEVAQFIYLLLSNQKIRSVLDSVTSKVVLILGRFTPRRKIILNAIRSKLKKNNYIPVIFDFDKPANRNTLETVTTLARLARFIIADITSPKSVPQELEAIVKDLPSVPVQPILRRGSKIWGMYDAVKIYPWVEKIYTYNSLSHLMETFDDAVMVPIEAKF